MAVTGSTSLSQLSSGHSSLYENYWRQADKGSGQLSANEAAAYLKRSNLSDVVLHQIWTLANPLGKAHLDKQGFYVTLRLIANAQNGKPVTLHDISSPGPAPNLGDVSISSVVPPLPNDGSGWLIQGPEKSKYDGVFESLVPVNGLLSGDKVKPILLNSNLHVDVLGRVWDLSDVDKDGKLDKDEFAVAMYLVYKALDGEPVPHILPPRLIPPSKRLLVRGSPSVSPGVSPTPKMVSSSVAHGSNDVPWVVTPAEKSKYDAMFKTADNDNDNLVTGDEVKNIFMASRLPQTSLAHIWGLCDMNNTGRLNVEQFALAMHLIHNKVKGIEPPQTLPPEMIPPSMRVAGQTLVVPATTTLDDVNKDTRSSGSMAGELDKITKEIEELGKTKSTLQKDIEETEDLVRHRHIEVQDLESELEKAKDEIKDLEKRKMETKSQLDKLDEEKEKYEGLFNEVQTKCQDETQKINSLKSQIADRDSSIQSQEDKLSTARNELNKLRQQETELEREVQGEKDKLENVQKQLKSVQTEISQVQTKLNAVKDANATLNGEINTYNDLLQTGGSTTNQSLGMSDFTPISSDGFSDLITTPSEMDTMSMRATAGSSPVSSISGFSVGSGRVDEAVDDDFKDKDGREDDKEVDPFKSKDDSEPSDPFTSDDPFKSDPFAQFKSVSFADPFSSDPFEEKDPFGHSDTKTPGSPFKSDPFTNPVTSETTQTSSSPDPFSSVDPFQTTFPDDKTSSDDFFSGDPFTSTSNHTSLSKSNSSSKDPFQTTDYFGSTDLFDGRPTQDSTDGNKPDDSSAFSDDKSDPFNSDSAKTGNDPFTASFANFPEPSKQRHHSKTTKSSEKDMIEWAKRQSRKDEKDRQKKMKSLQHEEQKQLALALKKSLEESNA